MTDQNGTMSAALVSILTQIHQAVGRVEARVEAGQTGTNQRIEDLRDESFHRFERLEYRMDRIETDRTDTPTATAMAWTIEVPWRLILKCAGYLLVGGLMALAHTKVPELKQVLGLMMQQQH